MLQRSGNIGLHYYLAVLAVGVRLMKVDETAALSEVLRNYQENNAGEHTEARLAIALTRVVENSIQPSLMKKLRPQDVDDVCSEIILGFWKFRHSVRPEEVGKLIHTLKDRRLTDQVRRYYRERDLRAPEPVSDEGELLSLLPARDGKPGTEAEQDVWDLLSALELKDKDRVIAYMVYIGAEKRVIASALNIHADTVTNSVKRCREALVQKGYGKSGGNSNG